MIPNGIPVLGHKVAFLVVAGKEAVYVVKDLELDLVDCLGFIFLSLKIEIFSSKRRFAKLTFQYSRRKYGAAAQCLNYFLPDLIQSLADVAQLLIFVLCESLFNSVHEIFMDEFSYLVSLEVKNPVDAKIQIRCLKLKNLFE